MLTFLKKLGQILVSASGVAAQVGPIVRPFLGSKSPLWLANVPNDLTLISQAVVQVEAFLSGPSRGPEKIKAALPLVLRILKTSEAFAGKKIANEELFQEGAQELSESIVKLLNSIHPDEAQHA